MILFVFEGEEIEPMAFDSLKRLFLTGEDVCVVKYGNDLPNLYKRLKENGEDLFRILPLEKFDNNIGNGARLDANISQIFLFFDYDFQNRMGVDRVNDILCEMLEFFDDETRNGKLYINYPMMESLKYTKELPDWNYWQYTVSRQTCAEHKFKEEAETFAYSEAKAFRFIRTEKMGEQAVRANWKMLEKQNVCKANHIITGRNVMPTHKEDIAQSAIFNAQIRKYVLPDDRVALLNSFPIFLYDYLKQPDTRTINDWAID